MCSFRWSPSTPTSRCSRRRRPSPAWPGTASPRCSPSTCAGPAVAARSSSTSCATGAAPRSSARTRCANIRGRPSPCRWTGRSWSAPPTQRTFISAISGSGSPSAATCSPASSISVNRSPRSCPVGACAAFRDAGSLGGTRGGSLRRSPPLVHLAERFDAVAGGGVRGKEAAAAGPRNLHQPGERVDHLLFGPADPAQELDTVAVGGVFLATAVATGHELTGDRRDGAAPREDLVEDDHADVEAGAQCLGLGDVPQVLVSHLVGEDGLQLVVVGFLQ